MHRRSKIFGSLIGAVLSFALVTGCASATDYPLALSTKLQASVQLVTQLSSDGKYNAALTALETLRGDLADARKDGSVSGERVKEIEAAIAAVEKELNAKIKAAEQAKETSAPEESTTTPAPETVPQTPVIPAPEPEEPVQTPAPADTGSTTPTQTPTSTPTEETTPPQTPEPTPTPTTPSSTSPEPPTDGESSGSPGRGGTPPSDESPDEGGGDTSSGTAKP